MNDRVRAVMSSDRSKSVRSPLGKNHLWWIKILLVMIAIGIGVAGWVFHIELAIRLGNKRARMMPRGPGWILFAARIAWALGWAVVISTLLPPRRPWRLLTRRPGFAACFTAVLVSLLGWTFRWADHRFVASYREGRTLSLFWTLAEFTAPAAFASSVAAAWLFLLVGGRWKFAADPVDRLGVVLGLFWLIAAPALSWLYSS